jgi:dienelactone hydrolase
MRISSETTSDGVSERHFTVDDIPGVLWSPAGAAVAGPLVLVAHGGGQHKTAPGVVARARRYVTGCGLAVAAIDAPGHGERSRTQEDEEFSAAIRQRFASGEPAWPLISRYNAVVARRAVPEWQATIAALRDLGLDGPAGFSGLSMGGVTGIALAAARPLLTAAVLGLTGGDELAEAAARITIPVEFLLQWDDEHVPREDGLALFGAFASRDKTLHANAGRHLDVPRFEVDSSAMFFARHLRAG